jgi:hypothetical protein
MLARPLTPVEEATLCSWAQITGRNRQTIQSILDFINPPTIAMKPGSAPAQ